MTQAPAPMESSVPREPMPADINYVYVWEIFNTASWSIVLGSPMLLFFQHLNASATILAIAASLPPFLITLQIPAARFVERVGYRRFVLSGWISRSVIILGMAAVAFLPESVDRATRMILMLGFSLVYNILRGISTCGLLPWFTHIVPESRRGEFLSKDQFASALASVTCLFFAGLLLHVHDHWPSYALLFFVSSTAGFISLYFLRRIPDVPTQKIVSNPEPMPWSEMILYPPFAKYIRFNVVVSMALGSSNVFWIRYFHMFLHITEAGILYVACATTAILAACLYVVGSVLDSTGNKQALILSCLLFAIHFLVWGGVAADIFPFSMVLLCFQMTLSGFASSLWNLANIRMVMGIVPHMGRPHFLAIYNVASSVTVAFVPLLWGPVMDATNHWHFCTGAWVWNSYSIFYGTLSVIMLTGLYLLRFVVEPITMTWDAFMSELLVRTPSRAISRLIGRLRGPTIG